MTVKELQHQLKELKRTSTSHSVTVALMSLQQELTKPPAVFDPYWALARLRMLVGLRQDNADTKITRLSTILHLPLGNSQFQNILLKLMGDKDVEIAKAIHKLDFLTSRAFACVARSYERRARSASESSTCFPCRESHQVTSFWRELLRMLHAALPVKLSKYFLHLTKSINGLVMEWRKKIHELNFYSGCCAGKHLPTMWQTGR